MKNLLYIIILTLLSSASYVQLSYAKKNVKKLSSKKMKGRGYVKQGELKAATYIAKEFKKHNLLQLTDNYFQYFETSINTQPSALKLVLNNSIKLIPGKDFLISPSSPSIKGEFKTILLNTNDLLNIDSLKQKLKIAKGLVLLIDTYTLDSLAKNEKEHVSKVISFLKHNPNNTAAASIIFTNNKLTWTGSVSKSKNTSFTVCKKIDLTSISEIYIESKSVFYQNYKTQNVIGLLKGSSTKDSTIVISAHYDHLGMMGKKTMFPGANDNASGIALLLDLTKYYSLKENQPKYDIVFIAFGAEEIGLIGSKYYTENPLSPLSNIKFMLNFDLAGTGDKGVKVVNATKFPQQFKQLKELNNKNNFLPQIESRGPACNSDHCFFYEKKVPVFYIYTLGGIRAYHDIYDQYRTLPFTKFEDYSALLKEFINTI